MSSYKKVVWEYPYLSAYVVVDDLNSTCILCKTKNKGVHVVMLSINRRKYSKYMHVVTNSRLHGICLRID